MQTVDLLVAIENNLRKSGRTAARVVGRTLDVEFDYRHTLARDQRPVALAGETLSWEQRRRGEAGDQL